MSPTFGPQHSTALLHTHKLHLHKNQMQRRPHFILNSLFLLVWLVCASWAASNLDKMTRLAEQRYGHAATQTILAWRNLVQLGLTTSPEEKLNQANSFFNRRVRFEDDLTIWRKSDYWATPLETIGKGAGDCEDFAIAKYITLREMGVPAEKLRLIYVRARIGGPQSTISQAHMVVGYYASANEEPLVLDNLISEIRPASRRTDLFPIFSFNSQGLWAGGTTVSDPTARLSNWRDALSRMSDEGFEP